MTGEEKTDKEQKDTFIYMARQQTSLQRTLTPQQEASLSRCLALPVRAGSLWSVACGRVVLEGICRTPHWVMLKWDGKCRAGDEHRGQVPLVSSLISITVAAEEVKGSSSMASRSARRYHNFYSPPRAHTVAGNRQRDERDIRHSVIRTTREKRWRRIAQLNTSSSLIPSFHDSLGVMLVFALISLLMNERGVYCPEGTDVCVWRGGGGGRGGPRSVLLVLCWSSWRQWRGTE